MGIKVRDNSRRTRDHGIHFEDRSGRLDGSNLVAYYMTTCRIPFESVQDDMTITLGEGAIFELIREDLPSAWCGGNPKFEL